MNIAFDGAALLGSMSKNRGIGNYTEDQFKTLLRTDRENRYFFFNCMEKTDIFAAEIREGMLQQDDFPLLFHGHCPAVPGFADFYGELIRSYIRKNHIDVFYITSPFDLSLPLYRKEWFGPAQVVATVYDIIPYLMQEQYFPNPEDINWYLERLETLRWADRLLAISQSVKDDLCSHLDFPGEKIDVIWGAPSGQFRVLPVYPPEERALRRRYGIKGSFVMCTGGDDHRKNIGRLIQAYARLPRKLRWAYQLVVVCKLSPESERRYSALAFSLGVAGRVVLTNYVSDEELVQLYNLCSLVAFPSTYEGFGLPVVEAWACGKPVLTSNNSSLGQIAEGAAELVDPFSVEDMARGLENALRKPRMAELTALGRARLPLFQWEKVAADSCAAISRLGGRTEKKAEAPGRKKLAFFTPLPPIRSGISDYSVDMLGALADSFDIDVFIDDGYEPVCELPENVRVLPFEEYEDRRPTYADTVYQLGNSEYHIYMWELLRRFGGTAVLHDYNLHVIFYYKTIVQDKDCDSFAAMLLEDYTPRELGDYIEELRTGGALRQMDFEPNGYLINSADRLIVHSADSYEKLMLRDSGKPLALIRSYAKIEPMQDKNEARRELDLPQDALLLAAFGHVHETKRIIPILRAFAALRKDYPSAMLLLVGQLAPTFAPWYEETVAQYDLADAVRLTGYTELEEFTAYMDASDICLNLRWPYNGETSGSLMRLLSKGKCVLVNDIGSFRELPDEACVKLPSAEGRREEEEAADMERALRELLSSQEKREMLEVNARRYAEETLDIRAIARQYADFINAAPKAAFSDGLIAALYNEARQTKRSEEELRSLAHTLSYAAEI